METCNWIIREGNNDSIYAFTPCEPGFNYLSKVRNMSEVEDCYNNRSCPICRKRIKCDMTLIK